jgi:predicted NUDIX family NTP pyrophosphohydrolase
VKTAELSLAASTLAGRGPYHWGMARRSAGLILFRETNGELEVLLVHPGGPYWAARDEGAWSIPKGLVEDGEDGLAAARRELAEETGATADGEAIALTPCRQKGGKIVEAWGVRGDFNPAALRSNTCLVEWPPGSRRQVEIPEVDRAGWFRLEDARRKILEGQRPLLNELEERLRLGPRR